MEDNQLIDLIQRYLSGECTSEERKIVENWYESQNVEDGDFYQNDTEQIRVAAERSLIAIRKKSGMPVPAKIFPLRRTWLRIAAAALLFVVAGTYFIVHKNAVAPIAIAKVQDIAPGGNKAILTLANGKQIILTGASNGRLVSQNTVTINKTADGLINYQASDAVGSEAAENMGYNTISTPRGGQYTVMLTDGTKIILNAASSLKYPEAFTGKERRVELTGEAYFEVAKNKSMPFRVVSDNQTVEVLGTHFNVNAYGDEPAITTTLLEGSVNIATSQHVTRKLAPGQQSVNSSAGRSVNVQQVDTELAIAWTKGRFKFKNESIESIMRKVSRWYNVDVTYQGDMQGKDFAGGISRYDNVSKVLDMLQSTNTIHFKIEGRRIIVTE